MNRKFISSVAAISCVVAVFVSTNTVFAVAEEGASENFNSYANDTTMEMAAMSVYPKWWYGVRNATAGKEPGDMVHAMGIKAATTDGRYAIDHYKGKNLPSTDESFRTAEFSFLYDNIGSNSITIHYTIDTNGAGQWTCDTDLIKIQDGKLYKFEKLKEPETAVETGYTVAPDTWHRFAIQTCGNLNGYRNVKIFFDGVEVASYNPGGNGIYVRDSIIRLNGARSTNSSLYIDDVNIHKGAYDGAKDIASYNESENLKNGVLTVESGTTVAEAKAMVEGASGKVYALQKLSGDAAYATDSAAITNSNAIMVKSPSGMAYKYIKVNVVPAKSKYDGEVTKIVGTDDESDAVAFYGTCTKVGENGFGFSVTLPSKANPHEFKYNGEVNNGSVVFGLLLTGVSEADIAGAAASFIE